MGCAALNSPPCVFSTSVVFAGCGVLKPLKRPDLGASGAFNVAALLAFSVPSVVASLFCEAPNKLKPGLLVAGVAVGVLAGLASDAKRFGLGLSAAVLLVWSAGLKPPNILFDVVEVLSWACGVDVGVKRDGVEFVVVGSFANGLFGGADAVGGLALGAAELGVPKRPTEGLSFFCAVEPKLKRLGAGAVAEALSEPCELVPKPPKAVF